MKDGKLWRNKCQINQLRSSAKNDTTKTLWITKEKFQNVELLH